MFIKFLITQHLFIQKLQFFESQASYKRLNKRYCRVATWPTNVKIRVFPRGDEGDRISASAARTKDPLARGGGSESTGAFDEKNIPAGSFFSFLFFFFRRDTSSMTRTEADSAQKTSLRLRARAGSRCYLVDTGRCFARCRYTVN